MRTLFDFLLRQLGCQRRVPRDPASETTMEGALARAAKRGVEAATVIDLGAAAGCWTSEARRYFPAARYLLIEPLEEQREKLTAFCTVNPGCEFTIAAAGGSEGTVSLNVSPDLDGSGIYARTNPKAVKRDVPLITLDAELARRALPAPYFLKFDTHGYELPILDGATETLRRTNLIIIEAYNFHLSPTCVRFHELCARLESLGFRCAELIDPLRRTRDGLLWQMDLVFQRADAPCFAYEQFA